MRLKNNNKAIRYLKKALKIDSNDWSCSLYIGECFLKLEKYDRAEKYLNYCLKTDTNSEKNIKLNFSLGRLHYIKHSYDLSLMYFDKCIKYEPKNYKAYHNKAMILLEQKNYKEAERLLEVSFSFNESLFPCYYELFKLKFLLNKDNEADQFLVKIEKNIEGYPTCCIEFAKIVVEKYKDAEKAQKYFHLAINRNQPNLTEFNRAIEYANFLFCKGLLPKSIECFKTLLSINDKDYKIYQNLNKVFISLNNYNDAIKTIMAYLKVSKDSIEANLDLADIHYYLKDFKKALNHYTFVENIQVKKENVDHNTKVDDMNLFKKIAFCNIKLSNFEKAISYLKKHISVKEKEMNINLIIAYLEFVYMKNKENYEIFLKVL